MGYSEAFINRTKEQLLERNGKLSREIAELEKEHGKVVEENKRLRNELAAAAERRNSDKRELDGVRGALNRESEMREKAENDRDQYRQEAAKWKSEADTLENQGRLLQKYQNEWMDRALDAEKERDDIKHVVDDVEEIQRKHNKLTLEDLDNALKQWSYIDNKLSHDLCMPLESLIQLLDEYKVNDFCKLRERLMYAPTAAYSNVLAQVRKLEKERDDLKHVADDLEKQRRDLEQKLAVKPDLATAQEARATDLESQLRRKTEECGDWMDRAFKDEEELRKVKEHDRMAQENFEKAARRNDELQNEVNRLQQRWTDTFNPEDELLGRKVLEWQEINVVLAKHNIENSMVLDFELDTLKEYRKVLDKHGQGLHGVMGPQYLDKRLSQSCPEEYMKVFSRYGIDSAEKLNGMLEKWFRVRQCSIMLRNDIPYLGSIADFIKELA